MNSQSRPQDSKMLAKKPARLDASLKPAQPKPNPASSMGPPPPTQRPNARLAKLTSENGPSKQGHSDMPGPSDIRDKLQSVLTRLLEPRLSALTLETEPLPLASTSAVSEVISGAPDQASAPLQSEPSNILERSVKAPQRAPVMPAPEHPPTAPAALTFANDIPAFRPASDPQALLNIPSLSEAFGRDVFDQSTSEGSNKNLVNNSLHLSASEVAEAQGGRRFRVQRLTSAVKASSASIRAVQKKALQAYQASDTSCVVTGQRHAILPAYIYSKLNILQRT
jgi:hypothetical protein